MFSFFHNTFWSRIVSFLTALVFSFSCLPANAQSIVPVTFSSFLIHPPYLKQLSERPTLYVIQDAHDSLEAQTGIRNILRELAAQDKIDTVLFEGGSRALARAFYDFDPDQKINQAIWDELFSQGALSGVERYGLEAPQKIDFVGVEDAETYLDDVQALADLFVRREKFEPAIRKENHKFKRLLEKQIPAPLKKILNQQDAFKDGRTSLEGRVRFLARNAETRLNLRLKEAQNQIHWPQLARFLKVLELEPAIHSAAIPAKLAQFRKRSLADSRLASLSFLWNANEHFRASGHVRWYFEEWIERAGNVPDAALYPWISYHVLKDELSPKALTEEVARLEELLIQNLAPSPATRKAIRSIREWERTKRLLRGELTREDWHEISASQRISRRFPSAVRHYRLAARRDKIIARNALRYFKAHPGRPAALVIGGFHTEAVTRALKSRDISFQLITPAISGQTQKIDYSSFFLPVLRTKHSTAKPHLGALPQNDKRVQVLRDEFHRLVNSLKVLGAESLGRKKALPDPENWPEEGDLGRLRQFFMWKKAELKKLGLKGAELEEALYENKRQLHGRLGGRAEHSDAVQGGKRAVFLRGMASKATEIGFQDMPTEEEVREAFKVLEAKQAVTLRKPKHKPVEYEPSINWEEKLLEAAEAVDGDQKGTEVLRNILEAACGKGDGRISTSDLQRRTSLKSENLKSLLEKLRDAGQVLVEENGEGASVRWAPLSTNGDTKARRAAIDAFLLNVLAPKEVVTSAPPSEIKDAEADTKAELAEPPPGPSPKAVPEIEFVTSVRVREAALGLETALNAKITEAQTRLEADEELNEKWIASIRSRITREIISGITERELEKRRKKILEKIDGGKYCQFQKTGLPETPATPSKDLSIDSKTFASKSPAQAQDYQLWLDSVWAVVLGMIRSVEQFAQEDEEVKAVAILIYRELEALRGRYASIPDILSLEKKMSRLRSRLNRLFSVFRNDLDPKMAAFVDDVNKTYDADTQAFEAMFALLDMLLLFGREHITVSHIISRGGLENYWELCRIFIDSILNKNKGEKSQSASLRTIGALRLGSELDRKEQDAVRYIRNIAKVSEAMPGSLTDTPIFFPSEDPEATDAAIKGIIPGQKQLAYTSYQSMKQDYRQRTVKATPSKSPAMYKFFAVFYVKERHILGDPEEIGAIEKTLNCGKRFQEGCPLIQKWEQAVPASSFPPDSELIPAGEVEGTQVQRLRRIFGERLHQQLGKLRDEIESLRSERWEVWELDSQAVQKVRKAISKLKVRSEIEARLWARWLQKEIDALSGHLKRTGAIPIFTDERISDRAPAAAGLPVPDAASRESNPRFWVNAICALILAMVHTTRFLDENGKIKLAAQNVLNLLQQSDAPTMDLFTALGGAIPEFYQAIEQSISLRYGHAIPQGSVLRDEKISSKAVPAFHLFFLHLFFLTLLMRVAVRAACEAGETNAGFIHLIFQKLFHAFWFDEMLNEQGYHFQLAISGPQDVPEEVSHSRLLHLGHALDREVRSMFAGNAYFVLRKMNMYFALEQGIAEAKNAVLEMQKLAPREGSIWVTGRGRENLVEIQREDIARQLDDAFPRGVRGEVHYSHIATLAGFEALDRQGVVDLDPDKNPELWKYWAWRYAHPKSTATPEDMLAIEKRLNGGRPFSEGIQLTAGSLGKVDLYDPETWPDQGEAGKLRRFFMWKKKNLGESGLHGKELKEALFENKQQLHRRLDGKGGHGDQVLTKRRTTFLKSMATKAKEAGFTDMPTLAYVEEVLAELHAATAQAKKNGGDSSGSSAASGQFMHDLSPPRKRGSSDFKSRGKSHWIPASAGMTKLPANLSNDELEEKLLTAALLVENDPHATTVLKIILEAAAKKESRIRAGDLQAKTALGPAEFAGAIELLRGNGHVVVEENGEEGEGEGEGEGERWVRWAYTTAADYKKRRDAISAFLANLWSEQPAEQVSSQANSPGTSNGDEARDRVEEPVFAAPAIHYASHEYVAAIRRRLGEALKEKIEAAEVEIDRRREELAEEWKLNDKHVSQMHSRMDTRIKDDMTEAALDARRDEILEMIEKDNYLSFVKSLPIFSSRLGAMTAPQESDDYQAWIDSVWALVLGMIRSAEPLVEKNDAFKVAMVAFYQILQNSREHYLEKEDVERFKRHIQGLRGYFDALFSAAHSENPDQASILKDGPDANGAFQYLLSLLDYSLTIASHNFSLLGQFGETRPEVLWAQYRTLVGGSIMASPESPQEEIPEQARQNQPFLSVELPPLLLLERKKRTEKMVAQVQEGFRTIFSGQACFWVRSEIGFPVTNAGHEDIVGDASLAETLSKGTHLTYRIARQSHHQGKLHARLPENARHKFWALYYFRMRYLSERNLIPFEDKEQIERNLNHGLLFREGCPIVERWIREMKSRVAANENLQLKGSGTIGVLSEEQASAVHSALEIMLEAKLRELNQEIEKRKVGWLEVCEIAPGSMKAIRDEIKKIRARKKVSAMRNKARQIEQDILALDLIRTQYLPLYGDDFPEDESLDVTARESDPNFWIHSVRVLVLAILKCSVSLKRYSQVRKAGEELLAQLEVLEARVMRRQFRPDVISETLQKVGQLKFKIGSAIITEYGNAIPQDTIFLDDKYAVNFKEIFNCLFWAVDDFVQLTGIAAVTSQAYGESSPGFFRFVFRILLKHFSSGTRDLSITFPQPLPQQNQTHPGVTRRMEKMRELLQQSWTTFMTDKKTFLEKRLLITVERGQFTKGEYIARIKELMGEDTGGFFSGEHDLDAEALRSGATPETLEDYLTPEFEGEGITREHKVLSVAFTKLQKLAASGQVDTDPRQNPEMWKYWAMRYVHPDSTATREELAEIERRFNGGKPFSEGIDLGANSANSLGNERLVDSRESSFRRGYGHKLETVRRVNRITGFVGADLAEYFPSIYAALLAQEEKQSLPSSEPIQIYSHPAYPAPACLERALHSRQLHQMA